jgi:hypothetical protein
MQDNGNPDGYLFLAVQVIIRAKRDSKSKNPELAKEAQEWLETTGRDWAEIILGEKNNALFSNQHRRNWRYPSLRYDRHL